MFEMLLSPRKAERNPWEMFFVGLFYASLSFLLVNIFFSRDAVLAKYSGILLVTFSVIFSLPFMYYLIKNEEEKNLQDTGIFRVLKQHSKALSALLWLFLGFVVAFSFWYTNPFGLFSNSAQSFKAQIETYCVINMPQNFESCVNQYQTKGSAIATGFVPAKEKIFTIFSNNMGVLIFTLVFSLIFGAGAIFVLAWNASVIAAAVGIFAKSEVSQLPIGLARYMVHGIPEIVSYFIAALAGGIISVAVIKHETKSEKFWDVLHDSLNLIIIAIFLLFLSALIEVFITPILF